MASPKVSPILPHSPTPTQTIESLIAVCAICKHDVHVNDLCECLICGCLYCGKAPNDCKGCDCENILTEFGANIAMLVNDETPRELTAEDAERLCQEFKSNVQRFILPDTKRTFNA